MAKSGEARKLAQRALQRRPGPVRWAALIQMLIDSALLIGMVFAAQNGRWLAAYPLVFAASFTALLANGPAVATARGGRCFENMTARRFAVLFLLALLPLLPLWGLIKAMNYINAEWKSLAQLAMGSGARLGISLTVLLGSALLLLLACLFISVFSRQLTLCMLESEKPLNRRRIFRLLKNALLHIFSPVKLFFSSFGWFALMALMLLLVTAAGYVSSGAWMGGLSVSDQLMLAAFFIMEQPALRVASALALCCVWIAGLGFVFWPTYLLKRVYYQRTLMRDGGVMKDD